MEQRAVGDEIYIPTVDKVLKATGLPLIVLGPETRGLPQALFDENPHHVRIPIWGQVRSLNLSTAAGVLLYAGIGLVCLLMGANFLNYGIIPTPEPRGMGMLGIEIGDAQPNRTEGLLLARDAVISDLAACVRAVHIEVDRRGGIRPYPRRRVSV